MELHHGDALEVLRTLSAESVHCCVTSPPYWGLRDYGVPGQIGLEPTVGEYVEKMVAVFREVRRVLRADGTCWLNLGDSYAGSWGAQSRGGPPSESSTLKGTGHVGGGPKIKSLSAVQIAAHPKGQTHTGTIRDPGLKPKDLAGVPWRVAFALQDDGWWLRSDIIWHKPNPMPESVTDRPTKAHEYVFLLAKSPTYYFDAEAVREPTLSLDPGHISYRPNSARIAEEGRKEFSAKHAMSARAYNSAGRNIRSVWTIATAPYAEAHFATFPPALAERCIKAGCPAGGTVLDPFAGAATTLLVADRLQRRGIGIELNPAYVAMATERVRSDAPLFAAVG